MFILEMAVFLAHSCYKSTLFIYTCHVIFQTTTKPTTNAKAGGKENAENAENEVISCAVAWNSVSPLIDMEIQDGRSWHQRFRELFTYT